MASGSNFTQSPRKIYQVPRNAVAPEYIPPPDNMHTYVKVLESCDADSATASVVGNTNLTNSKSSQQYLENNRIANETTDSSAAIIDVVAEEEAQNAKFFQRNIGILPMREKQSRRISFNGIVC